MSLKKVLVTGAAGGIGKSICECFVKEGYFVLGVDKKEINNETTYKTIKFDISLLGNNSNEEELFFDKINQILGGSIDVLINNAAVQIIKPIDKVTPFDWKTTLDTNLLAPFWLIQKISPMLKKNNGNIINISSIHSVLTKEKFSIYATSKGALVSMTRALAIELAPEIRVNAVIPAATDTPMLREGFKGNMKGLEELGYYHPMDRIAKAEEVAKVVLFLAGDQSSFITGSALHVDGGIGSVLHDPVIAR